MADERPILVVGAGPTGLTLACELARHGARVRIVERLPEIVPLCRATAIHSRTLEIFDDLGVVEEVLAAGSPVRGLCQYADGERFAHARFEPVDSPYPFTVNIEQYRTEAILESLLGRLGVEVERETELVGLADRMDGVRATLRRGGGLEELDAPWVVGCDGAHSTVRHLNRQHFPGDEDPRQYVLGDVVAEEPLAPDEIHLFLSDRGPLFLFPLPGERRLLVADVPEHHDVRTEAPELDDLRRLASERASRDLGLCDPRWLGYFRVHYRVARHYRRGRTLLAGDAVHVHSPIGGQGLNTGVQDAVNLAWKLALVVGGRAPVTLVDSYEKERRAVAEDVVEATRRATEGVEAYAGLAPADRDRLFFHAVTPEAERVRLAREREELDLDYRRSPICRESVGRRARGAPGGPHAGAQAVDVGRLRVEGRTLRLFELLRGPRHALLLFVDPAREERSRARLAQLGQAVQARHAGEIAVWLVETGPGAAESARPASLACVHDPEHALRDRYGAPGECLYLIRPDGYVGYRGRPAAARPFREYLDRILVSSAG